MKMFAKHQSYLYPHQGCVVTIWTGEFSLCFLPARSGSFSHHDYLEDGATVPSSMTPDTHKEQCYKNSQFNTLNNGRLPSRL